MNTLVVGTTVPTFKALDDEDSIWLGAAKSITQDALNCGFDRVKFFAAIETDSRGLEPFGKLIERLKNLNTEVSSGTFWQFSINDGSRKLDGTNRLIRITTGRNLIHEYALRSESVSTVLFLDSDLRVPGDCVSKLMEMNYPIVGGDVPSYCLSGPVVSDYPYPVQEHWNTAGFLLVTRDVIAKIRWRIDLDKGMSDDPCFAADAEAAGFGLTRVRKDVIGVHTPLAALEDRGHDLRILH